MKPIFNKVANIENQLIDLYSIIKDEPISYANEKLKSHKKFFIDHLDKFKELKLINDHGATVSWIGDKPTIDIAYNFYCLISNRTETFDDILNGFNFGENYTSQEFNELLKFMNRYENEKGVVLNNFVEYEIPITELDEGIIETVEIDENFTLNSEERLALIEENRNLRKELGGIKFQNTELMSEINRFKNLPQTNLNNEVLMNEVKNLLKEISLYLINKVDPLLNNIDLISKNTSARQRKIIATLSSVQKNVVTTPSNFYALFEHLLDDMNGTTLHESISERKKRLQNELDKLNLIIDENNKNVYIK
jgi:hypothetical protein